jgi:chaperone required for assembly of F1-ATPase
MGGKVIRTRTTLKLPTVDIAVMMTDLSSMAELDAVYGVEGYGSEVEAAERKERNQAELSYLE